MKKTYIATIYLGASNKKTNIEFRSFSVKSLTAAWAVARESCTSGLKVMSVRETAQH